MRNHYSEKRTRTLSLTWEPVEQAGDRRDEPLWIIYALGGGTGHWTRAVSLARQAARHGIATRILTNSPSQFLCTLESKTNRKLVTNFIRLDPRIEIVPIPATFAKDQISTVCQRELSAARSQDVVIVDSFPCGIAGELRESLRDLSAYKVFIHRDLNPDYVRWGNLEDYVKEYDFVISPGDDGPLNHLVHVRTNPWLVCDADEFVPRKLARNLFGVDESSGLPLIVVSGCGTSDESLQLAKFALRLDREFGTNCHIRLTSLNERAVHEAGKIGATIWPLLAVLAGVDLLIGAGGYHTVYESRVTETPLFAIAQKRLYDRQARRLLTTERASDFNELKECVGKFLTNVNVSKTEFLQTFSNGAAEAFEVIAACHRL